MNKRDHTILPTLSLHKYIVFIKLTFILISCQSLASSFRVHSTCFTLKCLTSRSSLMVRSRAERYEERLFNQNPSPGLWSPWGRPHSQNKHRTLFIDARRHGNHSLFVWIRNYFSFFPPQMFRFLLQSRRWDLRHSFVSICSGMFLQNKGRVEVMLWQDNTSALVHLCTSYLCS